MRAGHVFSLDRIDDRALCAIIAQLPVPHLAESARRF
jgi:hypothetical protein